MRADPKYRTRPCVYCETLTRFELDVRGPRGAVTYVPACVPCCEQPARRKRDAA